MQAAVEALEQAREPLPGTFEAVAREWLSTVHEAKSGAGHAERTRIRFERDAFPWVGARLIADIDAPELLTVVRKVAACSPLR